MGTVVDRIAVTGAGWRGRHSALHVAVAAAKTCLEHAGRDPNEVDLLVNAGLYRDKNLGEPALAALIEEDIGANPEDPHAGAHGTFSFDVANGTCGVRRRIHAVADDPLRSCRGKRCRPRRRDERALSVLTCRGGDGMWLDGGRVRTRRCLLGEHTRRR
jgi:hypothetical protein